MAKVILGGEVGARRSANLSVLCLHFLVGFAWTKKLPQYMLRQHLCRLFSEENATVGHYDVNTFWIEQALSLFARAKSSQALAEYCLMPYIGLSSTLWRPWSTKSLKESLFCALTWN